MSINTVLTHLAGRQVEIFYALLVSSADYTFLPELYDIFGREDTIKFLEVFSGCKIAVPRVETLEKLARNAIIYVRIERAHNRRRPTVVKTLMNEYELSENRIRDIHKKTKKKLEDELGFKLIEKTRHVR